MMAKSWVFSGLSFFPCHPHDIFKESPSTSLDKHFEVLLVLFSIRKYYRRADGLEVSSEGGLNVDSFEDKKFIFLFLSLWNEGCLPIMREIKKFCHLFFLAVHDVFGRPKSWHVFPDKSRAVTKMKWNFIKEINFSLPSYYGMDLGILLLSSMEAASISPPNQVKAVKFQLMRDYLNQMN